MGDVAIDMRETAWDAVEEHCFSRVDVEVGGFLLGRLDGDSVTVEAAKPALTASSEQTHLTFTHEAWAEILEVLDTEFPGLAIVGWYHSHPGFGCFLSDYDVFIQENFFSAPGQHALVVDPIAGTWGQFVAADGASTEIGSGRTSRPPVGGTGDKVDVVPAAPARGRRTWPAVVAGVVAASLVVGGPAWFAGNVQGRDAATASASDRVEQAEQSAAALQQQLADAEAALAAVPASPSPDPATGPVTEPSPSAEPTPDGEEPPDGPGSDPGPLLLAVGETGVFAVEHVVERGDTLWDLAARYLGDGMQYRRLLRANPEVREQGLEPGQRLSILMRGTLRSTD